MPRLILSIHFRDGEPEIRQGPHFDAVRDVIGGGLRSASYARGGMRRVHAQLYPTHGPNRHRSQGRRAA